MSPQRQSSLFGDRHMHTHTHTLSYTHTKIHTHTRSVMIHQSSKVGYACHFGSLRLRRCVNSHSMLFILRLKVRSAAVFPSHPSHNVPYAMPHWDRRIKRWIKSKLWPYPHQYHTDTSRDGRLASTYGHVPPSQGTRPSWTHTNTHLQLVAHSHSLSPLYDSSGAFLPASNNIPSLPAPCKALWGIILFQNVQHWYLLPCAAILIPRIVTSKTMNRCLVGSKRGFHKGPLIWTRGAWLTPCNRSNMHSICSDYSHRFITKSYTNQRAVLLVSCCFYSCTYVLLGKTSMNTVHMHL